MIKKILFIGFFGLLVNLSAFAAEGISGDIFGKYVGILHPSLTIDMMYSDNIYKTSEDTESDFITMFSPSICLAFPGIREKLPEIDVANTAPGGLNLELTKSDTFRRYQTYFYYSPQVIRYLDFSEENVENHRLGGVFQFNLRGGLSINLIEQYQKSHEGMGIGMSRLQDGFQSNLLHLIIHYDVTDRISLRGDASNFQLGYDNDQFMYGDRADNLFAAYVYYKILAKTSVFGEIDYLTVGYDNPGFYNSAEIHYFTGVKWDITDKTDGSFKVGYGAKDFTDDPVDNGGEFILELKSNIKFTPKTNLRLTGLRRSTETTILNTEYSVVNSFLADYNQQITGKIGLNLGTLLAGEKYIGDVLYGEEVMQREDTRFRFLTAVDYRFTDWLSTRVEYSYSMRSSNVDEFDYSNNVVMISITGAL